MTRDELINEPDDSKAPEWARFKAQDKNGQWRWHEKKPRSYEPEWFSIERDAPASKGQIPAGHDWRETLKEVKPMTTTPNAPSWPEDQAEVYELQVLTHEERAAALDTGKCFDGMKCGFHNPEYGPVYCDDCPNRPESEQDTINPGHYRAGKVECIDALEAATINKNGIEAVCTANAIKYLWRYESKGGLEDVRKAIWYLDRLEQHLSD